MLRRWRPSWTTAGALRPVDVCVEVGMAGGAPAAASIGLSTRWPARPRRLPSLRLIGVAGYEAALGHDVDARHVGRRHRPTWRRFAFRRGAVGSDCSRPTASSSTAGGSTYFDAVADVLRGRLGGPCAPSCAAAATSPTTTGSTPDVTAAGWAASGTRGLGTGAVASGAGLALLRWAAATCRSIRTCRAIGLSPATSPSSTISTPIWARPATTASMWALARFGISHPCTTFDKWPMIPVLDDDDRVVDLIRTFF